MLEVAEEALRQALKKKGVGSIGNKRVPIKLMEAALPTLTNPEVNLNTKAVFWTACLLLDSSSEDEKILLQQTLENKQLIPLELQSLLDPTLWNQKGQELLELVYKVIQKQNLTQEEVKSAADQFWKESTPNWLKGAFLQAMRLKRETLVENFTLFESMFQKVQRAKVDVPVLFDICDSYDGTNRSYHLAPYYAATLASLGYSAIIHGVESLAPKYGITNHQLMKCGEKRVNLSVEEAKEQVSDSKIGWAYIDQSQFFPELYALTQLRHDILKRPFLATFDKLLQPIQNKKGNVIITGYVHAEYRERLPKLLSIQDECHTFINLRSIEGSSNCWIKKKTPVIAYQKTDSTNINQEIHDVPETLDDTKQFFEDKNLKLIDEKISPEDFGFQDIQQDVYREITTEEIHNSAIKALQGEKNLTQDLIIYHTAVFLYLSGAVPNSTKATEQARKTVESGQALKHWQAHQ